MTLSDGSGWLSKTALLVGLAAAVVTVLTYLGIHYTQATQPSPGPVSTSPPPPGETPTLSPPPDVTRASYVASADQVCARWFQETGRLEAGRQDSNSLEYDLQMMDRGLLIGSSMLNEWQSITPPTADREEVDGIIADQWRDYELAQEARHAIAAGDYSRGLALIEEAEKDDTTQHQRALKYGFRVCR